MVFFVFSLEENRRRRGTSCCCCFGCFPPFVCGNNKVHAAGDQTLNSTFSARASRLTIRSSGCGSNKVSSSSAFCQRIDFPTQSYAYAASYYTTTQLPRDLPFGWRWNSAGNCGRAPRCSSCRPDRGTFAKRPGRCRTCGPDPSRRTSAAAATGSPRPPTASYRTSASAGIAGSPPSASLYCTRTKFPLLGNYTHKLRKYTDTNLEADNYVPNSEVFLADETLLRFGFPPGFVSVPVRTAHSRVSECRSGPAQTCCVHPN